MPWRVLRTILILSLGFAAACGGSASRDQRASRGPNAAGGGGDGPESGGTQGSTPTGGASVAGSAVSGATAGGSHAGDVSGAGGGPDATDLLLPRGCEPRANTETADTCSLALFCDTVSRTTSCHRLGSGEWRCQCEPVHGENIYHVENATGLRACALVAHVCSEKEPVLGTEICADSSASSPQGSCSVELTCRKPVELDFVTRARAWLMRFGSATCQRAEADDPLDCNCVYDAVISDYDVLVDGDEPACRPLVDLCMSGMPPEFTGEEVCWMTDAVANDEGCERHEACIVPMSLNDDVRVGKAEPRYASCVPQVGGGSDCYCSTQNSTFGFRTSVAPGAAACETSVLNCAPDAVIEATGASICEPTSVDTSSTRCDANLDCLQDATVDGREIVAKGRLVLSCARVDQGAPWWCSCASDQKTARFQLGAPQIDAAQACRQAPARCLENLSVHLGSYGEFVPPPDPLSGE